MVSKDPDNTNLLVNKSGTYNNLGNIYFEKAIITKNPTEYKFALNYHQKALDIQHKIDDPRGISHSYINMAGIYEKLNREILSIEYYSKALEIIIPLNLKEEQKACYEGLSEVFEKKKDFEKSLFIFKNLTLLKILF